MMYAVIKAEKLLRALSRTLWEISFIMPGHSDVFYYSDNELFLCTFTFLLFHENGSICARLDSVSSRSS